MREIRVLMITSTPPVPTWGGAMTFYRHFCEREDFAVAVITDDPAVKGMDSDYSYQLINHGWLWNRMATTRLYKIPHTYSKVVGVAKVDHRLTDFAESFRPDVVFTVAGNWSWMAIIAAKIARKLNVPLVGSFNDWWFYNSIHSKYASSLIENKYRNFYQKCDLAICTSEGMKEAMGPHDNAIVLYPTGSKMQLKERVPATGRKVFTVAFAGNLGDWYGTMLERLVDSCTDTSIEFRFYGSNPSWSKAFHEMCLGKGIYRGHLPFDELRDKMSEVDALLLLMGFDPSCEQVEKTSFKTKFLDYLSFQKPILLWGPHYCSAVRIAEEFDSAEVCTSGNAEDFAVLIGRIRKDLQRQDILVDNALNMYNNRFHPDKIHEMLVQSIRSIIPKADGQASV